MNRILTKIANNIANNIVRNNVNNFSAKEDTSMNTLNNTNNNANVRRNTIARIVRFACALLAFASLLALTGRAANADVVVDKFVGPQETYNVAPGTTALQLKVRNTDGYNVSSVSIQTYIYLASDVNNGWTVRAMPNSGAFSLSAYQSKWITITIPQYSLQGASLRNKYLYAKALLNSHEYWLNNFYNIPAQADVQAADIQTTGMSNGAKVFTIRFTNNGHAASTSQTAKVVTFQYADGKVGTPKTQTATLPALQVGESKTVTFTSQATDGYDIHGTVQVGSGAIVSFTL